MGDLVLDDLGEALELGTGAVLGVREKDRLTEGHTTEVLHRPRGKVRDRDEIELVTGVGDVEVLGEEPQRVRRTLECRLGEMRLPRDVDHSDRDPGRVAWRCRLEWADDEGDEVRRHHHRVGEHDTVGAIGERRRGDLRRVRHRKQPRRSVERDREDRFRVRLVVARERSTGVGLFELGRRDEPLDTLVVGELAPVEAAELVVEDAREGELERVLTEVEGGR